MTTPPNPSPESVRFPRFIAIALLITALILIFSLPIGKRPTQSDLSLVRKQLRDGQVASVEVLSQEQRIRGEFVPLESSDGVAIVDTFDCIVPTDELMTQLLNELDAFNEAHPEQPVHLTVEGNTSPLFLTLIGMLPWLLFGGIAFWLIWRYQRQQASGAGHPFGRSRAKAADQARRVTFAEVAGIEEAKDEVYEIIEFLRDPERFRRLGGRIPKGVLLVGPPGTGKTLLARAVAGEAGVPFFSISGSDFVEMFVGVGAARVRDLFRQARDHSPCILFLDEIDAVGRRRGNSAAGGSEEREQTLNAILVEMDGFEADAGVIVIAASNRPDVLDPALLRPGRFDREIAVDLPDMKGRREILAVHSRRVPLAESVDLERVARGTPGFSGADLEALVNEAALLAALDNLDEVTEALLEEARDKVRWGRAKRSRVMNDDDRRVTAYHEAGHAILAHLLPEVEPLHKVTIIPRGPSLGSTMQLPERDQYHLSRSQAFGNLMVLLGGRIAESQFCADICSGASNDLERVSQLARRMVCEWGMSPRIGPIVYSYHESWSGDESPAVKPLGEETRREIDNEVRRLIEEAYAMAEELIEKHADDVERIAQELLAIETLSGIEVADLLVRRPIAVAACLAT